MMVLPQGVTHDLGPPQSMVNQFNGVVLEAAASYDSKNQQKLHDLYIEYVHAMLIISFSLWSGIVYNLIRYMHVSEKC